MLVQKICYFSHNFTVDIFYLYVVSSYIYVNFIFNCIIYLTYGNLGAFGHEHAPFPQERETVRTTTDRKMECSSIRTV